jgi:hypothetical protein
MSAWEYAAPMTFLLCDVFDVLDVVRQNGEADLMLVITTSIVKVSGGLTKSDLYVGKQTVSYPGCYDACCGRKDTNRPGPFPGRSVSKMKNSTGLYWSKRSPAAASSSW